MWVSGGKAFQTEGTARAKASEAGAGPESRHSKAASADGKSEEGGRVIKATNYKQL